MPRVNRENVLYQGKLAEYAALVRAYAGRVDLVSPGDLDRFEERHIADSLRLLPLVATAAPPFVDVGSGAGLPGIPLAIAGPGPWRLLEPRARRRAFLEEVIRALELDCEVFALRAEDAAADPALAQAHGLATARALAPPPEASRLLEPLVRPGGVIALFVGAGANVPGAEVWAEGIATMTRSSPTSEGKSG